MSSSSKKNESLYGGQAIIEGVMFKSRHALSYAVRDPDGNIVTKAWKHISFVQKHRFFALPFLRGFSSLLEMMFIGSKVLSESADIAIGEDSKTDKKGSFQSLFGILSVVFGVILALFLFKALPYVSSLFFASLLNVTTNSTILVLEGILKLCILLGYVYLISFMPDIRRVFMYHGAEHKVIRCFEAKKPITVSNVQKSTRFHPRCGTSFLVFVVILSIIVYAFIPDVGIWWVHLLQRIALLPVIAGISFELIQWSAKFQDNKFVKPFIMLGYGVQLLTTREPTDDQVEVSIASFRACKACEEKYMRT